MSKISDDLREILAAGLATTQEELGEALANKGHDANQSKISRLLRKIGAVKAKNEAGDIVYRLPKEPAPPTPSSRLSTLVINAVANEWSIIVTTSPGSASMIARILDHKKEQCHILGTIAGDDTILIIPESAKDIRRSLMQIQKILFGE